VSLTSGLIWSLGSSIGSPKPRRGAPERIIVRLVVWHKSFVQLIRAPLPGMPRGKEVSAYPHFQFARLNSDSLCDTWQIISGRIAVFLTRAVHQAV
jgi:hypothetical protein